MLILIRHGKSTWNKKNIFTGWVDVPLSQEGIEESIAVGNKIARVPIAKIFTSTLVRSQMTVALAFMQHESGKTPVFLHTGKEGEWGKIYSAEQEKETIPVVISSSLNERMYGELQGMNKDEMRKKFGEAQVQTWRRSYDGLPPGGESLAMTIKRTVPYFEKEIQPLVQKGENILVVAHGNSLRGIAMVLENLTPDEVVHLEIATGEALCYTYERGK